MNERIKIYLSSTFSDLKAYREATNEVLTNDIVNKEIELISAETAAPTPEEVWDRVEKDVMGCDFYFLILANKYGSIPDNAKNIDKISYTEHEFRTAVKNNKKIIVFRSNDISLENCVDFDSNNEIDIKKQDKLNALKKHEKSQLYGPSPFTNVYDFKVQIILAIYLQLKHTKYKLTDFVEHIHLCCDRKRQIGIFTKVSANKNAFNTFIIQGDNDDVGLDLIKRICLSKLGFSNFIPARAFIDDITDNNKNSAFKSILNHYSRRLSSKELCENTEEKLVQEFIKKNVVDNKSIVIILEAETKQIAEAHINIITFFIKTCAENAISKIGEKIYFFLNLVKSENHKISLPTIVSKILQGTMNSEGYCYDTERLAKVERRDIERWLTEEMGNEQAKAIQITETKFKKFCKGKHDMLDVQLDIYDYLDNIK